jgi:hypothetical protein
MAARYSKVARLPLRTKWLPLSMVMSSTGSWYERQRPPACMAASIKVTGAPRPARRTAADRPARPAPTI